MTTYVEGVDYGSLYWCSYGKHQGLRSEFYTDNTSESGVQGHCKKHRYAYNKLRKLEVGGDVGLCPVFGLRCYNSPESANNAREYLQWHQLHPNRELIMACRQCGYHHRIRVDGFKALVGGMRPAYDVWEDNEFILVRFRPEPTEDPMP